MKNARIAIIEDRESTREAVKIFLETRGHTVVGEAATLDVALGLIDQIGEGATQTDIIVLDGNLRPNVETGEDARQVMQRIKERGVSAAVLGFSERSMASYGVEVTADSGKGLTALSNLIAEL